MSNVEINPQVVANDVVVSMDYSLKVDGQVIDSTQEGSPIEFLQGYNNIIAGLEKQLNGMAVGESREIILQPGEAYGEFDPNAFFEIERGQFPAGFAFQIGRTIRVRDDQGGIHQATICEIGEEMIRLDLNHPLAGKELTFKVTIAGLRAATPAELSRGRIGGCSGCSSSDCDPNTCR